MADDSFALFSPEQVKCHSNLFMNSLSKASGIILTSSNWGLGRFKHIKQKKMKESCATCASVPEWLETVIQIDTFQQVEKKTKLAHHFKSGQLYLVHYLEVMSCM